MPKKGTPQMTWRAVGFMVLGVSENAGEVRAVTVLAIQAVDAHCEVVVARHHLSHKDF